MAWYVEFTDRNGFAVAVPQQLQFEPTRYDWTAIGGPHWAEISVSGAQMELLRLLGWLRYGVTVRNALFEPVWWGYVHAAEIQVGENRYGASLEEMYNRVAVAYSFVAPGSQSVGVRETTDWTAYADSINEYGTREMLASIDGATQAQAEAVRDRMLVEQRWPVMLPITSGNRSQLICYGWWRTLDWRYYANSATDSTATTAQIADIVTAAGQFLTGMDIVTASGLSTSEYRAGDNTALDVMTTLLRAGTADGRRLLATVTPERRLRIVAEAAAAGAALQVKPNRQFSDRFGNPLPDGALPVGQWVLQDGIPQVSAVVSMSPLFLEEAEYDIQKGVISPTWRGLSSAWDLSRITEG